MHLEAAILRRRVAESVHGSCVRLGEHMGNAPLVADDFDRAVRDIFGSRAGDRKSQDHGCQQAANRAPLL